MTWTTKIPPWSDWYVKGLKAGKTSHRFFIIIIIIIIIKLIRIDVKAKYFISFHFTHNTEYVFSAPGYMGLIPLTVILNFLCYKE